MDDKRLINKLFNALNDLQDIDLKKLSLILGKPNASIALKSLVDGLLTLRDQHHSPNDSYGEPYHVEGRLVNSVSNQIRSQKKSPFTSDIEHVFWLLLNDKSVFPRTKDVIRAMNIIFGFKVAYNEYYKRGRRDLINRYKKLISELPENRRSNLIGDFILFIRRELPENDDYLEYFKVIAGNDKNT